MDRLPLVQTMGVVALAGFLVTVVGTSCAQADSYRLVETNGVVRADVADKPLTQSPIADEPYGSVLVFRDPDNIQLEFFASPET